VVRHLSVAFASLLLTGPLFADGPSDNLPDKVRRVPPPGIEIDASDYAELAKGAGDLAREIHNLRIKLKDQPALLDLLPDVHVFYKSVHDALVYHEIYDVKEVAQAKRQLALGMERAKDLAEGKAPWLEKPGLVVRGYRSKIDDSIQPYGLVVPANFKPGGSTKHRLDFWCHGRGEKLTELSFINGRLNSPGEFTPPGAFVLHLYGRYCCANKFSGEVDLFEAYDSVKKNYPIDENRLVIRGFSMGGAACWQFAVHYPGFFCAAAPGAGFSETPEFLKVFQKEDVKPTWYEQKLWNWYDCPGYAANLFNLPTVAYSGEIDSQKQAADVMEKAFEREGMKLTHLIGPKTGHAYHKDTKVELNKLIDALAAKGRDPLPKKIRFATYTLRYNKSHWLTVDQLEEHWKQARVEAEIIDKTNIKVTTTNVVALRLRFPRGSKVLTGDQAKIDIDSQSINLTDWPDGAPLILAKTDGKWDLPKRAEQLRKVHRLQGPIDDAFLDRFIMVAPSGEGMHTATGKWVDAEMKHAIVHWQRQFRGVAIQKKDSEIGDDDIASSNLVLWGDPASNKILARIIDKLPIKWNGKELGIGEQLFDVSHHMPALIYPNPLNPKKYVVLNSGFTFREYDYLNNARQVPKLPDWTIVDVNQPMTSRAPGGIAAAGFFDETWKYKAPKQ
jgi:dienelactone hydrolase